MSWWYENEVEEMKLYKNEDLCIECKNEFFSKPYDHRDPTPGQLGYCIKCDNCLIKEKKMEFDNSRLYTCVNATELHIGDKVYVGNDLAFIKDWWRHNCHTDVLTEIRTDGWERRFGVEREGEIEYFALAYLVERAENCTNCCKTECSAHSEHDDFKVAVCSNWIPKAEPKTEQKAENYGDFNCEAVREAYNEKHYRPFKDTDELIEKWWKLDGWSKAEAKYKKDKLRMPLIWLKNKYNLCHISSLVTGFFDSKVIISGEKIESMEMLYADWVFPDGSPCGVEE